MSQIGNIQNSFGKQFNIAIANTYSYNVLSGSNLPVNSLIIASNVDDKLNDTGSYSLIATDAYGIPVRLTYTISEGNGLYYSVNEDAISLHIDNNTIINTTAGLKFDVSYILSDNFDLNGNDITININSIPSAFRNSLGIARIDGKTLKLDGDVLYVSTDALQYSNNETEQYGIGIGDGKSIITDNGEVKLNLDSLIKASDSNYGVVIGDGETINIEEGIISVNTRNLEYATESRYGISKPDNKTIIFNENTDITVNEENLKTATSTSYGLVKIDTASLNINDGKISMKNYDTINSYISEYNETVNKYQDKIDEFNEYLSSGNILFKNKDIQLFSVNETSVGELVHPKENEEIINMPLQTISAEFNIITTCDFKVSIIFEEGTNEFPVVDILEVNYNDEFIYDKEQALDVNTIYPSTEGNKKKLIIKFTAKNYRNSITSKYIVTSVNVTLSNSEDNSRSKTEKYSIVRYNALYSLTKEAEEEEKERKKRSQYVVNQNDVYWR